MLDHYSCSKEAGDRVHGKHAKNSHNNSHNNDRSGFFHGCHLNIFGFSVTLSDWDLWHFRLGHPNFVFIVCKLKCHRFRSRLVQQFIPNHLISCILI
ncbi:unnamed protein product, partial [Linum tenue]